MEKLYNFKIIESGNRVEVYAINGTITEGGESKNIDGRRGAKGNTKGSKARRQQTLYEARNNIIRLVNCNNDMIVFCTLTYADNMQDLKKSRNDLQYFFQKLHKDYEYLKYLWVMEYQERGAIHFHILLNIDLPIKHLNGRKSNNHKELEQCFNKKYWNRGFIDLKKLDDNNQAAKYIATYLVKDLLELDLGGYRVYSYSKNLNKPKVSKIFIPNTGVETVVSIYQDYKVQYVNNYDIKYKNKDGNEVSKKVNYYDLIKGDCINENITC